MISEARKNEICKAALDVLSEYDLFVLPIDPRVVAEQESIAIKGFSPSSEGISGFLMKSGDDFIIAYSERLRNRGYENFTVAHELGHYFLDGHIEEILGDGNTHFSISGFTSNNKFEREADLFASELLMPGKIIEPHLKETEIGLSSVKRIAAICSTSLTASALKYASLTPDHVIVVLSTGESIQWMFTSDSLSEYRTPKEKLKPLPIHSATRAFNQNRDNIELARENGKEISLQEWLAFAPDEAAYEEVIGLGSYGYSLTIISLEEIAESYSENTYSDKNEDNWIERMEKGVFRSKK